MNPRSCGLDGPFLRYLAVSELAGEDPQRQWRFGSVGHVLNALKSIDSIDDRIINDLAGLFLSGLRLHAASKSPMTALDNAA
jgi:hypothetical protein